MNAAIQVPEDFVWRRMNAAKTDKEKNVAAARIEWQLQLASQLRERLLELNRSPNRIRLQRLSTRRLFCNGCGHMHTAYSTHCKLCLRRKGKRATDARFDHNRIILNGGEPVQRVLLCRHKKRRFFPAAKRPISRERQEEVERLFAAHLADTDIGAAEREAQVTA